MEKPWKKALKMLTDREHVCAGNSTVHCSADYRETKLNFAETSSSYLMFRQNFPIKFYIPDDHILFNDL